jgi:formylglycine-generating enzyme required for sulfatase activity
MRVPFLGPRSYRAGFYLTSGALFAGQGQSFGCADMAGNVWKWCSSQYRKAPYRAVDGRERTRGKKLRAI